MKWPYYSIVENLGSRVFDCTITTYFFLLRVLNKPIFIKNIRLTSNGGWRPRPGSIPDAVVARLFGQRLNLFLAILSYSYASFEAL